MTAKNEASGYSADLKRKTAISIVWTIVRAFSDQVFAFVVFLLLARILPKADIGLFAMAFIFGEVGRIIAANGLTQTVARADDLCPRFLDTVFWTNMAVAGLYVLIALVASPLAAMLLHEPRLDDVIRVLSIAVIINAAGATHLAARLREFGHKTLALRALVSGLIGGGAAIAAAFAGWGVWSLVVQRLVTETVQSILSWRAYDWTPSFEIDWRQVRQNLRFGGDLTIAQLILLMLVRVQDLIIAGALGAAAVGVYRVAWRCTEIFASGAIQPFSSVSLQTFSRLRGDTEGLRAAYRSLLMQSSALSFPVLVGYGVLAPQVVQLFFGAKWAEAGHLGQIFAVLCIPFTLNYFSSPVYEAMGDARKQRIQAVVQLVSTVVLSGIFVRWGLWWVAVAYVLRAYLVLPLQAWFLYQCAGITVWDAVRAIRVPAIAATVMGIVVAVAARFLPHAGVFSVGALVLLGAVVYVGLVLRLSPPLREKGLALVAKLRAKAAGLPRPEEA